MMIAFGAQEHSNNSNRSIQCVSPSRASTRSVRLFPTCVYFLKGDVGSFVLGWEDDKKPPAAACGSWHTYIVLVGYSPVAFVPVISVVKRVAFEGRA